MAKHVKLHVIPVDLSQPMEGFKDPAKLSCNLQCLPLYWWVRMTSWSECLRCSPCCLSILGLKERT